MNIQRPQMTRDQLIDSVMKTLWDNEETPAVGFDDTRCQAEKIADQILRDQDPARLFTLKEGARFTLSEEIVIVNGGDEFIILSDSDSIRFNKSEAAELADFLSQWAGV